ncbi:unnamed protein product [Phytophthora fragariaefolia]|uniref:RxLR effector protein n=1 Tax=Phytophthora fragariaefolia TaxID=1490495 RepID=A0A9W7D254_9STRA|nr:unnamed protein product [Phytophthora fragariaefolia]
MRLSFLLSIVVFIGHAVACNASDHTKTSMILDAAQNGEAASKRFLRVHESELSEKEERVFGIGRISEGQQVRNQAKEIMENYSEALRIFRLWEANGYTLSRLKTLLKSKKKYDQVYNSYAIHLDLAA